MPTPFIILGGGGHAARPVLRDGRRDGGIEPVKTLKVFFQHFQLSALSAFSTFFSTFSRSGLDDCLDCLAEKGEHPKVSGRAVSTSVDDTSLLLKHPFLETYWVQFLN